MTIELCVFSDSDAQSMGGITTINTTITVFHKVLTINLDNFQKYTLLNYSFKGEGNSRAKLLRVQPFCGRQRWGGLQTLDMTALKGCLGPQLHDPARLARVPTVP